MRRVAIRLEDGESVSGIVDRPKVPSGTLFVLGHGAGGDMTAPLLASMAKGLSKRGHTVLRFRFRYREQGKKAPDRAPILEATFRSALARALDLGTFERVVLGGKSMGGRMATHLAAQGVEHDGVVLFGYPLHPAGKKDKLRDAHLRTIERPMLFLQGTRDPLCDLGILRRVLRRVPSATLHVVEGGDHSLAVLKSSGKTASDVDRESLATIDGWLRTSRAR